MADEGEHIHMEPQSNAGKWILMVLAVLVVAGFGYASYVNHEAVKQLTAELVASQNQVRELQARMQTAEAEEETLARQAGITKKELSQRAAQLQAEQRASALRIEQEQKAQISAVSGDIAGVKTDVGGVKTDVASTRADLEATKAKLQSAVGDLGVQSGLIAKNFSELDLLKHRGDRNYFDFTAKKNQRLPVSTVSIVLKKTDSKKSRFTLNVIADDKTIEKKDRNANEPMQFYSGRDKQLYELVVFTVDKDTVTGYLSTPKVQNQ